MVDAPVQGLTPLAKFVLVLGIGMVAAGAIWHGVAFDDTKRLWRDLFERPGGPMSFRFVLQPVMAAAAALHDGILDARANRSPYLWSLMNEPWRRSVRLSEGLVSTARIMLLGIGMDVVYQTQALGTFYPAEAVIIALVLAFVPYLILRGPIARITRWWMHRHEHGSSQGIHR
jgi:hypothetical protein